MDTSEIGGTRLDSGPSLAARLRTFLVLGRVSNLPTVWSNCLAAWLLAGGGGWRNLALVCFGATLLYTGGMFLNDAVDAAFDRRYRPERPIPSGLASSRTVWAFSVALLIAGWLVFLVLGTGPLLFAAVLALAIVLYDLFHKRTALAPFLMASCRFLLYLVAAASATGGLHSLVLWKALALAGYIVGLSCMARGESTGGRFTPWAILLLFVPAVVAFAVPMADFSAVAPAAALELAWLGWCLYPQRPRLVRFLPKGIAGFLAGIVLVDWLAAPAQGIGLVFVALFFLALFFQRVAPAT